MAEDKSKSPVIGNIVDAFKILDFININNQVGISTIAQELKMPKTRVFRILKSLEETNAVKQLDNSNYCLDYHMLKYANSVTDNNNIVSIAEPHMKKAVEITNESINLGMQYKDDLVIIRRIHGEFYQLQTALRPVGDLYCSGMGKIFLSSRSDEELEDYFANKPKRTIKTINTLDEFKIQQREFFETGIAYDDEEYEYGLSCYAVPIYNSKGEAQYALSISGPSRRLEYKGIDFLMNTLKECALNIQNELALDK